MAGDVALRGVHAGVADAGADLGLSAIGQAKLIQILVTPPITPATAVPFSVYRSNY